MASAMVVVARRRVMWLCPEPLSAHGSARAEMVRNRAIDASRPQLFQPLPVKL